MKAQRYRYALIAEASSGPVLLEEDLRFLEALAACRAHRAPETVLPVDSEGRWLSIIVHQEAAPPPQPRKQLALFGGTS